MTFKITKINSKDLSNQLNKDIFDGQYSSDINLLELKKCYLDYVYSNGLDICKNKNGNLMVGYQLEWDSNHFGFNCYRIDFLNIKEEFFFEGEIDEYLRKKNIKLSFLRINENDKLNFLISNHFKHFSSKFMYRRLLENNNCIKSNSVITLNQLEPKKIDSLIAKILQETPNLFKYNRFFYDKNINREKAVSLYQNWVINSAKLEKNNFFLLLDNNKKIAAFCILSIINYFTIKVARIDMIGTLNRGKNCGTKILQEVFSILNKRKIAVLYANADSQNYAAQNLYAKNGFKIYNSIREYHNWIK